MYVEYQEWMGYNGDNSLPCPPIYLFYDIMKCYCALAKH